MITKNEISMVTNELKERLNKFNAPTDDVDNIVNEMCNTAHSKASLKLLSQKVYFRRHPEIAKRIHVEWHETRQ